MDHAEAETEGHAPLNEIADDPPQRRNSMEPTDTTAAMAVDVDVDVDGLTAAHLGWMDIDATGIEEGSVGDAADGEPFSVATVEPTPLMSTTVAMPAAAPDGDGLGVEPSQVEQQQPPLDSTVTTLREMDPERSLEGGPPAMKPAVESAVSSEAITSMEVPGSGASESDLTSQPTSIPLIISPTGYSSFDRGQAMSVDEEDSGIISDKASSVDPLSESDAAPPPPQDQTRARQHSERAPLVNIYGPFIRRYLPCGCKRASPCGT